MRPSATIDPVIFISHSSKDASLAGEIQTELRDAHYRSFLAHADIGAASDWHSEIWQCLRDCHAFIGLVTDDFNESAYCQQEVGAAFALDKPRLLVKLGPPNPPGFSGRFQGVKRQNLVEALNSGKPFRMLRVQAWVDATTSAGDFHAANAVVSFFRAEWDTMTDDERLRWLLVASANAQVSNGVRPSASARLFKPRKSSYEARVSAPFFRQKYEEVKYLLTDEWLAENDTNGVLHELT
jgi:TIR domain